MEMYCADKTDEEQPIPELDMEIKEEPPDDVTDTILTPSVPTTEAEPVHIYQILGEECCVRGCKNRPHDPAFPHRRIQFFSLPAQIHRRRAWLERIGREEEEGEVTPAPLRICGVHFPPEMILKEGKLVAGAVPCLFLPRSCYRKLPHPTTKRPTGENTNFKAPLKVSYQWCAHVCRGMLALQESGTLCDVHLAGSDGTILAHSVILSVTCPALTSLFSSMTSPSSGQETHTVDLSAHPAHVIAHVVRLCYTGLRIHDIPYLDDDVISCAADLGLNIQDMKKMMGSECTVKVKKNIMESVRAPTFSRTLPGQRQAMTSALPGKPKAAVVTSEIKYPTIPNAKTEVKPRQGFCQKRTNERPSHVTLTLDAAALRRSRTQSVTLAELEPGCVGLKALLAPKFFNPKNKVLGVQYSKKNGRFMKTPAKLMEVLSVEVGEEAETVVVTIATNPSKPASTAPDPYREVQQLMDSSKNLGNCVKKRRKYKCYRCLRNFLYKTSHEKHLARGDCVKPEEGDVSQDSDVTPERDDDVTNSNVSGDEEVVDDVSEDQIKTDDVTDLFPAGLDIPGDIEGILATSHDDVTRPDSEEGAVDYKADNDYDDVMTADNSDVTRAIDDDFDDDEEGAVNYKHASRASVMSQPRMSRDSAPEVTSGSGVKRKRRDSDPEYRPPGALLAALEAEEVDEGEGEGEEGEGEGGKGEASSMSGRYDCSLSHRSYREVEYETRLINLHNLELRKGEDKRWTCSRCGYNCKDHSMFYRHLVEKHDIIYTLQCKLCDRKLQTYTAGWQHLNDHVFCNFMKCPVVCDDKLSQFRCYRCEMTFDKQERFETHAQTCDGQTLCPICGVKYAVKRIKQHIESHNDVKVECKICGAKLVKTSLSAHVKAMHKDDKHVCITCGKVFNRKCNLQIHERIHTGVKPFVCDICGKAFRVKCLLHLHQKHH